VDASIRWAQCARDLGFDTKDPEVPVADNYATYPTALLPDDLTAEDLNQLLSNCPIRDSAAPSDETMPLIGFDVPGFDGKRSINDLSEEDARRYGELLEIIHESIPR
jgi:hypothetical protein